MSEANEPKLLPCPFCGSGKVKYDIYGDENEYDSLECKQCGFWMNVPPEIEDNAKEIWNRRTPPAPQWTTELPKEIGWYMVLRGEGHGMFCVEVFLYRGHLFVKNGYGERSLEQFLNEYTTQTLWLKVDVPPPERIACEDV